MLGRTQKKVEHEREREVGNGRWRIEEKWRKYLHGWYVTAFLTNFCMFKCELHCKILGTCIILIVNLPSKQEGMDQFMREKKINK